MTENQLELETLLWLGDVGDTRLYGPKIGADGEAIQKAAA